MSGLYTERELADISAHISVQKSLLQRRANETSHIMHRDDDGTQTIVATFTDTINSALTRTAVLVRASGISKWRQVSYFDSSTLLSADELRAIESTTRPDDTFRSRTSGQTHLFDNLNGTAEQITAILWPSSAP